MSCSSFWLDNSTDRLVASVSWIYQLKVSGLHVPFLPRFNEKINYCNIMRKLVILIGARHMLSVTETWVMTWIVAGEHPSRKCALLNAPSSIFAEGFPTFVLRWNTSIVSFRKFFSFIFSGSKERRTSGLLWFPSNLDCMNAISRAVRRYFRSSSWNLAQILFKRLSLIVEIFFSFITWAELCSVNGNSSHFVQILFSGYH